jgi:hypothetical protein
MRAWRLGGRQVLATSLDHQPQRTGSAGCDTYFNQRGAWLGLAWLQVQVWLGLGWAGLGWLSLAWL